MTGRYWDHYRQATRPREEDDGVGPGSRGGGTFKAIATALSAVFLVVWWGSVEASVRAETAGDSFFLGSQAYFSGNYPAAAAYFGHAVDGAPAAGVLHNLGNAEWCGGHPGEAVLAWERAQWLDPLNANTRANLRFARKTAHLEGPDLAWYEVYSAWLPASVWAVLAAASFWLATVLVAMPNLMQWRRADWHQGGAAVGFTLFLLTIPALIGIDTRSRLGVVLPDQVSLRLTPTREAQSLAKLAAGETARLERERGDFVYVRVNREAAGWVLRSEFGRICALK
jgi:hypothetical protein